MNSVYVERIKKKYGQSYKVVYWATEERRDMGESDIYESNLPLEEAVSTARKLVEKYVASAEARVDDIDSELDEETVFYCSPDEKNENYVEEWLV